MTVPTPTEIEGLLERASGTYDDHSDWLDDVHGYGAADKQLRNYGAYLPALLARIKELEAALEELETFADRGHPLRTGFSHGDRTRKQLESDMLSIAAIARAALTLNKDSTHER